MHSPPPSSRSRPEPVPTTPPAPPAASRSSAGSRRSRACAARSAAARAAASASSATPGEPEEALRELDRLAAARRPRIANRAGYACSLGSAGWAGLEPGARYFFTVESVRRLVARRDQVVKSRRWVPLAGLAATWQTLLNSVTFGHNVALGALGRGESAPAKHRWQRRIDALASVVLAIPALLIALPIELAGGLFRRGAVDLAPLRAALSRPS